MAKKNNVQTIGNTVITPEMLMQNPNRVSKDVYNVIKKIAKAQANVENAGAEIAYYLNVMSETSASNKTPAYKLLGYSSFADYAQAFHNISPSTCRVYKSAAKNIVRDKFGIHSRYAQFYYDGETPVKVERDFTVSQLVELINVPSVMVKYMISSEYMGYNTRTKVLRNFAVMTKKLLNGQKASFYKPEELCAMCDRINNAMALIDAKSVDIDTALAFAGKFLETDDQSDIVSAFDAQGAQEGAQGAQEGTQECAQEGAQDTQEGAQGAQEDTQGVSDYVTAFQAFERAFDVLMQYMTDIQYMHDANDRLLDMAETVEQAIQDAENSAD